MWDLAGRVWQSSVHQLHAWASFEILVAYSLLVTPFLQHGPSNTMIIASMLTVILEHKTQHSLEDQRVETDCDHLSGDLDPGLRMRIWLGSRIRDWKLTPPPPPRIRPPLSHAGRAALTRSGIGI